MPQSSTIPVDGNDDVLVNVAASNVPLTVSGSLGTYSILNPSYTGTYSIALVDVAGTVASNNYVAIFNPVASGKLIVGLSATVSAYSINTVNSGQSMQAFRTTAQSGGTLVSNSTINKFDTNYANSAVEIRTGNPTVTTTGLPIIGFPPALGTGAQAPVTNVSPPSGTADVFHQGQGLVLQVPVGNASEVWDIQLVWAEVTGS
jgi:hypothetical protein